MRRRDDDRGSALILVLVLVVIGGFMVVPLMSYAVTTVRANQVVRERTVDSEAVKGGLRAALASAGTLFETCTTHDPVELAVPSVDGVTTTCAQLAELRRSDAGSMAGVHETWEGSEPPAGFTDAAWIPEAFDTTWFDALGVPGVPAGELAEREPPGDAPCRVFYPGIYRAPVTLAGPAYFASGIYHFTAPLTITDGADVVAGAGPAGATGGSGCATDAGAAAAFAGPGEHGITGLGATFVLGDDGRLVLDDRGGGLQFTINPRFGDGDDSLGAGVSIVSVDGELTATGVADLRMPGHLHVPATDDAPIDPSTVVPHTKLPGPPIIVDAATFGATVGGQPAIVVTWQAPPPTEFPVTSYSVSVAGADVPCRQLDTTSSTTNRVLSCLVRPAGFGVATTIEVVARNAAGTSPPATATRTVAPAAAAVTAPTPPLGVRVVGSPVIAGITATSYHDAIVVEWNAPANSGGAPLTGFTAESMLSIDVTDLTAGITAGGLLNGVSSTIAQALFDQLQAENPPPCTNLLLGCVLTLLGTGIVGITSCVSVIPLVLDLPCVLNALLAPVVGNVIATLNSALPPALRVTPTGPLLQQLDQVVRVVLAARLVPQLERVLGGLDGDADWSTLDLGGRRTCSAVEDMRAAPAAAPDPERFCVIDLTGAGLDVLQVLDAATGIDADVLLAQPLIDALVAQLDAVLGSTTGPLGAALGALLGNDWLGDLVGGLDASAVVGAVRGNLLSAGVVVSATAHNAVGSSSAQTTLAALSLLGDDLCDPAGARYVAAYCPGPYVYEPDVVLDVRTGPESQVRVPGYVAVPQGIVRLAVDAGSAIELSGGLLAAYIAGAESCTDPCSLTPEDRVAQRTVRITSRYEGSTVVSDARVQVNANGAWAINSWVVQPEPRTAP